MKNFDDHRRARATAEEREFKIGGEQFRCKAAVRPETIAPFDDIQDETPVLETLALVDSIVVGMLEPDDDAELRYRALRAREADPLTVDDLLELVGWMIEKVTGRPTVLPGGSSAGPGTTGTNSTEGSSSPELRAV